MKTKTQFMKTKALMLFAVFYLGLMNWSWAQTPFFEDFETSGGGGFTGSVVTLATGQWFIRGYMSMTQTDHYSGERGVRLRGDNTRDTSTANTIAGNYVEMRFNKSDGAGTVTFKYGSFSSHSGGRLQLQLSTDNGITWQDKGDEIVAPSWVDGGSVLQTATIEVYQTGSVRIRIYKPQQSGNTSVNIDDITITDYIGTDPLVTTTPSNTLDFENVNIGTPNTLTLNIKGFNLTEDLTVNITGEEFTAIPTSITKDDAMSTEGYNITVTFTPLSVQTCSGTLTITSDEISDVTVNLTGSGIIPQPVFYNLLWNFTDGTSNPSNIVENLTVSAMTVGNTLGTLSLSYVNQQVPSTYTGASKTFNIGNACKTGELNTKTSAYFEFTLTPDDNYKIKLTEISFGVRSTTTGAQAWSLRSSKDDYATSLVSGNITADGNWMLPSIETFDFENDEATTFRIYVYNGSGNAISGTINTKLDDINLLLQLISIPPKVATPTFDPAGGTYNEVQYVTISTTTEDAIIYYTTDGSTPTEESEVYAEPVEINSNTTLKAIAVKESLRNSAVAEAVYTITVGVAENVIPEILIYPNPVKNILNIEVSTNALLEILDLTGRQLMVKTLETGTHQMNFQNYTNGFYLVKIENRIFKIAKQ